MSHQPVPRIRAVATAVPPHPVPQARAKAFAASFFESSFKNLSRLLPVFDNTHIQCRYLAQPPAWYARPHTFPEANALYETIALDLSVQAATAALERAEVELDSVGMVIFVSTTGLATPSLDAKLIQRLGLSLHTGRLPIWGLGCAGGVAGVARAADLARAMPGRPVLLVAVELCSLTFQYNDRSKSNLIATSLFGDGAAAAVIQADAGDNDNESEDEDDKNRPAILGSYSTLFADSEDVMGWDLADTGLKVRFSRHIPTIVRRHLPTLIAEACSRWGIEKTAIQHYVAHPGGAKVLTAYADSLGLSEQDLALAYEILQNYGNMSSVSVLFVLEKFLASPRAGGQYGLMMALGPGFSAEQVLFR